MITGFSIILNDDIIYCSNENQYTIFEIVLFLKELLTNINPKHTWLLHKMKLQSLHIQKEIMIIKHIYIDGDQLFYCISGDFSEYSKKSSEMLNEFQKKVETYYSSIEVLKQSQKKELFTTIIENIVDYLWDEYETALEEEDLDEDVMYQGFENNRIIYCGLSTQGLPIISQLFDDSLLKNLEFKVDEEKRELFVSSISSKLATISINALIRAKSHINTILIQDIDENCYKYIFFGELDVYTVDMFGSGNYFQINEIFEDLVSNLKVSGLLEIEFVGDLKPFKGLSKYIEDFVSRETI